MFKQRKNKDASTTENLLTGLLVCTLFLFAFLCITTVVLYLGDDPTYRSELWSFAAFLLSGAVAGAVICRMQSTGGLVIAVLSALELVLILFIIAVISFGIPSLPTIVNYGVYIAIVAISAFLSKMKPKKYKPHR